jgi:Uma2 family endonuclease
MTQPANGPIIALADHGVEIPPGIVDLESFRKWARSDGFPERGRIDWVAGRLEVDMSPEDLNTHGSPKSAVAGELINRIQELDRGLVYIDRARVSNPCADLSAEPDIVVVLFETVESGEARLVPKASGETGRFVEIEGRVDLVVECVSDSSETRDRGRLPRRFWIAGIPEYWVVDGRGEAVSLEILSRGSEEYEATPCDERGFRRSEILQAKVRLSRRRERAGLVVFRLEVE